MSFSVSFFARDVQAAQTKLREAYAPAAVKALVELALAGIPSASQSPYAGAGQAMTGQDAAKAAAEGAGVNRSVPRTPKLCGILVETNGHIDENGQRSGIATFRVEPFYD